MVHTFLAGLSDSLASGSWLLLPVIFVFSFAASFNPCMFSMMPLIIKGTGQSRRAMVQFCGGFTLMLMLLGSISAGMGHAITLPAVLWSIFLGILYLILGLVMVKEYLPISFSGFYIPRKMKFPLEPMGNHLNINPFNLGVLFAISPSPCTVPAVMAIAGYVLATGHVLFGALALGAFALGHSLFLALAFLPSIRRHINSLRLLRRVKPVIGVIFVVVALYLLISQPAFIDNTMLTHRP